MNYTYYYLSENDILSYGFATIRVNTVKVLPGNDERGRVLRAIGRRFEEYPDERVCFASKSFARELLRPFGVLAGNNFENLSLAFTLVLVITDGSQTPEEIYEALNREASKENKSITMRVLTPQWLLATESGTNATLWNVGSIGVSYGMTYSTYGGITCYDREYLEFLKKKKKYEL
jgi:hypothetical protein